MTWTTVQVATVAKENMWDLQRSHFHNPLQFTDHPSLAGRDLLALHSLTATLLNPLKTCTASLVPGVESNKRRPHLLPARAWCRGVARLGDARHFQLSSPLGRTQIHLNKKTSLLHVVYMCVQCEKLYTHSSHPSATLMTRNVPTIPKHNRQRICIGTTNSADRECSLRCASTHACNLFQDQCLQAYRQMSDDLSRALRKVEGRQCLAGGGGLG